RGKPRQIPYLRLSGEWLEAAGFEVGCKVSIQVTRRRLVMHVVED
ncbi:TPA: type I toxin-antitoxin system SymE family toxin, partial [Pseudomonas aeruginosa]|nr:SymE family type I addiction module toxin [Pseudomonas aeruginosa]HBO7163452.1 type I toxin-antitoxin system SymE family toxin [Pseudomonas aeruginosa]HEP9173654.1 SymE family type I addiction module toxin [Pseudomonas aeruginosa]